MAPLVDSRSPTDHQVASPPSLAMYRKAAGPSRDEASVSSRPLDASSGRRGGSLPSQQQQRHHQWKQQQQSLMKAPVCGTTSGRTASTTQTPQPQDAPPSVDVSRVQPCAAGSRRARNAAAEATLVAAGDSAVEEDGYFADDLDDEYDADGAVEDGTPRGSDCGALPSPRSPHRKQQQKLLKNPVSPPPPTHTPQQQQQHKQASYQRPRFSAEQTRVLEREFDLDRNLDGERRARLAEELGVQARQVAVWFQNRRARWRYKRAEQDMGDVSCRYLEAVARCESIQRSYDALQKEYQSVLFQNAALCCKVADLMKALEEEKALSLEDQRHQEQQEQHSTDAHVAECAELAAAPAAQAPEATQVVTSSPCAAHGGAAATPAAAAACNGGHAQQSSDLTWPDSCQAGAAAGDCTAPMLCCSGGSACTGKGRGGERLGERLPEGSVGPTTPTPTRQKRPWSMLDAPPAAAAAAISSVPAAAAAWRSSGPNSSGGSGGAASGQTCTSEGEDCGECQFTKRLHYSWSQTSFSDASAVATPDAGAWCTPTGSPRTPGCLSGPRTPRLLLEADGRRASYGSAPSPCPACAVPLLCLDDTAVDAEAYGSSSSSASNTRAIQPARVRLGFDIQRETCGQSAAAAAVKGCGGDAGALCSDNFAAMSPTSSCATVATMANVCHRKSCSNPFAEALASAAAASKSTPSAARSTGVHAGSVSPAQQLAQHSPAVAAAAIAAPDFAAALAAVVAAAGLPNAAVQSGAGAIQDAAPLPASPSCDVLQSAAAAVDLESQGCFATTFSGPAGRPTDAAVADNHDLWLNEDGSANTTSKSSQYDQLQGHLPQQQHEGLDDTFLFGMSLNREQDHLPGHEHVHMSGNTDNLDQSVTVAAAASAAAAAAATTDNYSLSDPHHSAVGAGAAEVAAPELILLPSLWWT